MKNSTIRDLSGYEVGKASNLGLIPTPITYIQTHITANFKANPNQQIWVRSNYIEEKDSGNRIAFTEKSELHPNGEAFIAGSSPQKVALTANVALALSDGEIIPCSQEEIENYEAERVERARRALETRKQDYLEKFVAVFGSAEGFDEAFKAIEKREGLAAAIEVLR
jgi:hypothetical protein